MRIGIVGDLHLPFGHPLYLDFCVDMFNQWKVDAVHFAGDIIDCYTISRHGFDPNGPSPGGEAEMALEAIQPWVDTFKEATVSIGNHDERVERRANESGLPRQYMKSLAEVLDTPKWNWELSHTIDGVLYEHGTGTSGKDAAYNRAVNKRQSTVIGHVHSYAGVKWHTSDQDRIFGLCVGCGVDIESMAMAYGKPFPVRPCLGCGIVLDGTHAYFEVMQCGTGEEYHRSRA